MIAAFCERNKLLNDKRSILPLPYFANKSMPPTPFDELQRISHASGVEKSLDFLEHQFRRDREYFKLFEVLKMRCRYKMGLPLTYSQQPDALDEAQQRQLEDGLLDACREIGTLFFKSGQFQEGWMYLQPVGDKLLNEKLVRSIEADDDNMDALIDVAVSQGAAPSYGYQLLLDHYGTCNGITTFDTQAGRFEKSTQKEMARVLLNHIYAELADNVRYAIKKQQESNPPSEPRAPVDLSGVTLDQMLADYPNLTAAGAHHIDTTHLASVMRIARLVDVPEDLQKASELARYGKQLHPDFQYPGSPPFEDTYIDHALFYQSLQGNDVESAIEHFEKKTHSSESDDQNCLAVETLVDLLVRLGRNREAISLMTERLLGKCEPMGIAPQPFDIANSPETLRQLREFYESDGDLLGFAVSLLNETQQGTPDAS